MILEGKNDAVFTINALDVSYKKSLKQRIINLVPGIISKPEFKIRVILITLDSGELEILIASLLDDQEFPYEVFLGLYNLRWGSEEHNKHLKSVAQLENFTGKTKIAVEQDFYATIFTCNVANMLAQEGIEEERSIMNKELNTSTLLTKILPWAY